jgi:hypothetical protein
LISKESLRLSAAGGNQMKAAEPYGNHGFSRGGRVIFVLYSVSERQVGAENGEKYRKQYVC